MFQDLLKTKILEAKMRAHFTTYRPWLIFCGKWILLLSKTVADMGLFSNPYCHIYYRVSVNFWYIYPRSVCSEGKNEDLLHEVILIGGYFTVLNTDNQVIATKSLSG